VGSGCIEVAEVRIDPGGSEAVEHQLDHGQLDERLRRLGALLPVLAEPPTSTQPPPPRGQTEFQVNLKLGLTPCPPLNRSDPEEPVSEFVTQETSLRGK